MIPELDANKPNRKIRVLSAAAAAALTINAGLLLLINSLISNRHREPTQAPKLHKVDFVRLPPKRKDTPQPVAESKPLVETVAANMTQPKPKPASKPKRRILPQKRPAKTPKSEKTHSEITELAAPRLDIPARSDGPAFPSVSGTNDRLTAPPAQWRQVNKGKEAEAKSGDADGAGYSKTRLVAVSRVLPEYPARARLQGIQGWVQLEITVSPNGRVSGAKVVDAKPKDVFEQAALKAIEQWRFKPAYREGQAVEQKALQRLHFRFN